MMALTHPISFHSASERGEILLTLSSGEPNIAKLPIERKRRVPGGIGASKSVSQIEVLKDHETILHIGQLSCDYGIHRRS